MINLPKPQFDVETVFGECISLVKNADVKEKYTQCLDLLKLAETDFINRFPLNEIYLIQRNDNITDEIGKDQMVKVYNYRMLNPNQAGRPYYDKLISLAKDGKCPYCAIRDADTIDHYLPKADYPIYSVTPIVLVPCCTLCQDKTIPYPTSEENQTFHPYFDEIENENWIKANVINTNPITFSYEINPPEEWPDILKKRAFYHFESYKLDELYSNHANEEYRGRKRYFSKLYTNGPEELIDFLFESYDSYLELGCNSWQAMMYKSLAESDWFQQHGILYP